MSNTDSTPNLEEWPSAYGPMSTDEPTLFDLKIETVDNNEFAILVGSVGDQREYDRDKFSSLVAEEEWLLARDDPDNQQIITHTGKIPY